MKVAILQSDSRPILEESISKKLNYNESQDSAEMIYSVNDGGLSYNWNYWSISKLINELKAKHLGYDYYFFKFENKKYHPAWEKINLILNFICNNNYDVVLYLDSDAWVRDHHLLGEIINYFYSTNKQGVFSRDPKISKNTYVNTGVQVWRRSDYSENILKQVVDFLENTSIEDLNKWPYEQKPLSELIEKNKNDFLICKVNVLNTPCGDAVRHCWNKNLMNELLVDEAFCCLSLSKKNKKNININELFEY